MANDKELKVQGTVVPKGQAWLAEVRLDAARNTIEHLRQQKEAQEFELAKARGVTTEEIIEKGKQDLGTPQGTEVVTPNLEPQVELEEESKEEQKEGLAEEVGDGNPKAKKGSK